MQISIKLIIIIGLIISHSVLSKDIDSLISKDDSFGIEFHTGYPSYHFNDLIEARNKALMVLPFPAKVTDDYPHIPYLHGEALIIEKYFEFGLAFTFVTTGSRATYSDYSGEYRYDNVISNYEYSLILKTRGPENSKPFKMQLYCQLGSSNIKIKSTENIRIKNESNNFSENLSASIKFLELGVNAGYYYKRFTFNAGVSYYVELEEVLSIGFTGIRAHLGTGFRL
jgi:hypothetical protein